MKPRKIKGKPTVRISGTSACHVLYSNILGLTVDKVQNWFAHINYLNIKLINCNHISPKLTFKSWYIKNTLSKFWYMIAIEEIRNIGRNFVGPPHKGSEKTNLHRSHLHTTYLEKIENNLQRYTSSRHKHPIYEFQMNKILYLHINAITQINFPHITI